MVGTAGFYYSQDYGENIVLRNSTGNLDDDFFGALLADFNDNTIYRIETRGFPPPVLFTTDGGFNWSIIDSVDCIPHYASGVISGEVYRLQDSVRFHLERSVNYGIDYTLCSTIGGPDSLGIHGVALGVDSGEVYIWGDHGKLFYSNDYAENFILLDDLYNSWGVSPISYMINGAVPGEVFIQAYQSKRVWRVFCYGDSVSLIEDFPPVYNFWIAGLAASHIPGELYYLIQRADMVPGGTMHIYHTTDYFQTYTMYEHVIEWEGVNDPQVSIFPSSIDLNVFPNPTNAAFNIAYELNTIQDVILKLYDILGRQVWQNNIGVQSPGDYRLSFAGDYLPSGKYFVYVGLGTSNCITHAIIIK